MVLSYNGRTSRPAWERRVEYEHKLLLREMERQDHLSPNMHDSDCACWTCVGRLQASVVQAYVRRMRLEQDAAHDEG